MRVKRRYKCACIALRAHFHLRLLLCKMLTCYFDIQGHYSSPVEVGLILVDRDQPCILKAQVLYGTVCNYSEFNKAQRYYHGMCPEFLERYGLQCHELRDAIIKVLCEWQPKWIAATGYDCLQFLRQCCILHNFREVHLPPWSERRKEKYYKTAFDLKRCSSTIENTQCACPYKMAHPFHTVCTDWIKELYGNDCSLYNALEIALFENSKLME